MCVMTFKQKKIAFAPLYFRLSYKAAYYHRTIPVIKNHGQIRIKFTSKLYYIQKKNQPGLHLSFRNILTIEENFALESATTT